MPTRSESSEQAEYFKVRSIRPCASGEHRSDQPGQSLILDPSSTQRPHAGRRSPATCTENRYPATEGARPEGAKWSTAPNPVTADSPANDRG